MGFCFCREGTSCKIQFEPSALLIGFLMASYRTEQASDDQGLEVLNGPGGDLKGSLHCLTRGQHLSGFSGGLRRGVPQYLLFLA